MCLDNRKCWKSKVNAWLRGDRTPFSFKCNLIGALSTREYMRKVFLQNHSWTTMWFRSLGSSFTCAQRCVIQWTSFAGAMFLAHFLMYEWPYDEIAQIDPGTGLRIPLEFIIRGDHAVAAGVLGSLAGAAFGGLLRLIVRLCAGANRWARVDDKDDFGHLRDPESLEFAHGAVVIANRPTYTGPKLPPYPPCVDESVLKILDSLSPNQTETLKHMIRCQKEECGMKTQLQTKTCCQDEENEISPTGVEEVEQAPAGDNVQVTLTQKEMDIPDHEPMEAERRGFKKSVANDMYNLWGAPWTGLVHPDEKGEDEGSNDGDVNNKKSNKGFPSPRAGVVNLTKKNEKSSKRKKGSKRSKKSKVTFEARNQVPSVSARFSDSLLGMGEEEEELIGESAESLVVDLPEDYDSLSDPESDEEIVTRPVSSELEVRKRRRPRKVYDGAPWWDDRHRVYVSAPTAGNMHHQAVNERYERTAEPETPCCKVRATATFGEDAILKYLEEEDEMESPGGVVEQSSPVATGICALALLGAVGLSPYIIYERLPLPNAHALYYLYSIILCLVFHIFAFCTLDGILCALLATCARRKRISRARIRKMNNEEDEELEDT